MDSIVLHKPWISLWLTIGIPGAGKSRWVKKFKEENPKAFVISTDDLRKSLTGVEQCINPAQNGMIHEEARKRVKEIIDSPWNGDPCDLSRKVVVDSTNCSVDEWRAYRNLGADWLHAVVFERSPEQAMENQKHRERQVPLEVVKMKWNEYEHDKSLLPFFFNQLSFIPFDTSS